MLWCNLAEGIDGGKKQGTNFISHGRADSYAGGWLSRLIASAKHHVHVITAGGLLCSNASQKSICSTLCACERCAGGMCYICEPASCCSCTISETFFPLALQMNSQFRNKAEPAGVVVNDKWVPAKNIHRTLTSPPPGPYCRSLDESSGRGSAAAKVAQVTV